MQQQSSETPTRTANVPYSSSTSQARGVLKRPLVVCLVAVVAGGLAVGGWMYRQHHRYKHFAIHETGRVYRSAWLEPDALKEVIQEHKIKTVINLCAPGEMGEERWRQERIATRAIGAQLIEIPLNHETDPHKDRYLKRHLEVMRNPDNYPILVHCKHGIARTAKWLAIYDVAIRNMTTLETFERLPRFGREEHMIENVAFSARFEQQRKKFLPPVRGGRRRPATDDETARDSRHPLDSEARSAGN